MTAIKPTCQGCKWDGGDCCGNMEKCIREVIYPDLWELKKEEKQTDKCEGCITWQKRPEGKLYCLMCARKYADFYRSIDLCLKPIKLDGIPIPSKPELPPIEKYKEFKNDRVTLEYLGTRINDLIDCIKYLYEREGK